LNAGSQHRAAEHGGALVVVVGITAVAAIILATASARVLVDARASAEAAARDRGRITAENTLEQVLGLLIGNDARAAEWRHGRDLTALMGVVSPNVTMTASGPGPLLDIDIGGDVTGTGLTARLRRVLPVDYVWFTDLDVLDPLLIGRHRADCVQAARHEPRGATCLQIPLRSLVIDGPVHVNDTLRVTDTSLRSVVSTAHSEPEGAPGVVTSLEPDTTPPVGGPFAVMVVASLELPTRHDDGLVGQAPTCRFAGPTLIRFDGASVRVLSPLTAAAAARPVGAAALPPLGCGELPLPSFAAPTTIILPKDAVIEVVHAIGIPCGAHPLGLGAREESGRDWSCWSGDAFVWGRYQGSRTVLAEGNIQLVWDVEPGTSVQADDLTLSSSHLGLVAADSILVRRLVGAPIRRIAPLGLNLAVAGPDLPPFGAYPSDAPVSSPSVWEAPRIVASLVALGGSVNAQNAMLGQQHVAPVTIHGSIAQRYRGIFGWDPADVVAGNGAWTGYGLNLVYDERLRTSAPPAMPSLGGHAVRVIDVRHR
jgi:hypothetical protein